jgi:ATP-dependent RNA helicase RhlE
MCHDPVQMQLERKSQPATGITQAVYPVPQELKSALLVTLLERGDMRDTLVFTRTKHRANRLHEYLLRRKVSVERIHGNRSQAQRTAALEGFKSGRHQVLVATDIASRGIDVDTLGHVVNFDVPLVPDDYIHRVGRTARAGATGHAFTFVSPEEESTLKPIERAIGKALPRVTVPDFNYAARPDARFEIPIADRIRAIRARKAEERARADRNRQRHSAGAHAGGGGSDTGGPGRGRTRHFRPKRRR